MGDPGFPIGGAEPLGGANLQRGHFSAKMYAKTKELDPVGGGGGTCRRHPPRSANDYLFHYLLREVTLCNVDCRPRSSCWSSASYLKVNKIPVY